MADWITIRSEALTASINPRGAELSSLADAQGRALMTDADPAYWTGRAPLLFPIVGRVRDDRLRSGGRDHAMGKHGFARRLPFALIDHSADRAHFRLEDTPETRAAYPFAFRLDAVFTLAGPTLDMAITIANPGDAPLPASFGFHPAFAWPLPYGAARENHAIEFAAPEPGALKRITPEGYSTTPVRPSPVEGTRLALADALFEDDALVWDPVNSQSLRYGAPGGPGLRIDFPDTPRLGIWTKPGARFICVEPWHGIADPEGWTGDFADKPGVFMVAPGGAWRGTMRVTLEP